MKAVSVGFYFKVYMCNYSIYMDSQKVQVLAEQPLTTIGFWPAVSVTGSSLNPALGV